MTITEKNRQIFNSVARLTSRMITHNYSTSFSISINLLDKSIRDAIYGIYGFVRVTDEIVDTFYDMEAREMLTDFRFETAKALEREISLNPVLHHFQQVVHQYKIDVTLIDAFFKSMEMDLDEQAYERKNYETYIHGSAEVVGLMCLKVFCNGDSEQYDVLKPYAISLGAAFQKVNFLRDIQQDKLELNRSYFPHFEGERLDPETKKKIEEEIEIDFENARQGIRLLPSNARFGVCVAYIYYRYLLKKIKKVSPGMIHTTRVRVSGWMKFILLFKAAIRHKLNLI